MKMKLIKVAKKDEASGQDVWRWFNEKQKQLNKYEFINISISPSLLDASKYTATINWGFSSKFEHPDAAIKFAGNIIKASNDLKKACQEIEKKFGFKLED